MFSCIKHSVVLAVAFFATIAIQAAARANTLYVSPNGGTGIYTKIQDAINAAGSGDTIVVAAGTYPESLVWRADNVNNLTILGAGADRTFIDPTAGANPPGGRCLYTWQLLAGSRIDGFTFQNGGANLGAGVFNDQFSDLTVTNCVFRDNVATDRGGGMYNNSCFNRGKVINCTFQNCRASAGGGMASNNSSPTLTNCVFIGNSASAAGAMYNENASSPRLTNCTFTGNTAGFTGGIYNYNFSNPTITNCILWGNNGEIYDNGTSTTVTYTDLQGLSDPAPNPSNGNNFGAAPLFVRNPFTNAPDDYGDLRLLAGSPCINVGANSAVPADVTTDLAGNPRIADGTVDLGAYEFRTAPTDTTAPTLSWGTATPAPNAAGWNNTAVDIPFTAADDSGAPPSASASSPLHFGAEGANQKTTVTVTDQAGNHADFPSPTVNIDMTAPTTTGSATGTATSTVTLSASDSTSGVKTTYYTVDFDPQQRTYNGPFTLAQGQHTVRYWSVDNADNTEAVKSLPVDTRLAVTLTVANASGKRGNKVSLSVTITQTSNGSKLISKTITFKVDGTTVGSAITDKKGGASLSYTIPTTFTAGSTHTISASFVGDSTFKDGNGAGTLTVTR